MANKFDSAWGFYEQLRYYYQENKGKIRRNYKDLTRKFLDYNDSDSNPKAFLRRPQFEALEMYVFVKEFMDNSQMFTMFDDWRNHRNNFDDSSYYSIRKDGQIGIFDEITEKQTDILFKQMKKYAEDYPNYIYALTMGLGKTILMATCIFYDFLLANKYPKDKRFCHNALVFAPDKTVLQSLREIVTFDKTLVVPSEYARVLDANIKIHFLEETGKTLNTLDDSNFNIIISNTQKIILKKKRTEDNSTTQLFKMKSNLLSDIYGDELNSENDLMFNQRFMKLCRLSQLGIYVDEAHHLFGANLEKELHANANKTSLRNTINQLAEDLKRNRTSVVACYNYTGTPYVKNQVLPEVVYAYGLKESIVNGFIKDADVKGFENVKNEGFLRAVITEFLEKYGGKTYEGLIPKLAVFASGISEAYDEVKPMVEKILAEKDIPASKILVNVGDQSITKNEDIRDFNNLDVVGTEGSKKQFIILVQKGQEGWNCRSLFGVALFRSPKSKIFVLQSTMRCLRQISDEQQTATVFLSKENFDTLNDELNKNFNMEIKDMKASNKKEKNEYKIRVLPPPREISIKSIKHKYSLIEKKHECQINFAISDLDLTKYEIKIYEKIGISKDMTIKEKSINKYKEIVKYSEFTLIGEISRYLNVSCIKVSDTLRNSVDGVDEILRVLNQYNEILYDVLIPKVFYYLYEVKSEIISKDKKITLLRSPVDADYYVFKANPELVITNQDKSLQKVLNKSFHADTYCFDSKPEKECFLQYIFSDKVKEIYFTGMFTSNQGDLAIQYYDPESQRIRNYYPDFFAQMDDGTYQIIEVKGDNKIDDLIVKIKAEAAEELATESSMQYKMYASSYIMENNILENNI